MRLRPENQQQQLPKQFQTAVISLNLCYRKVLAISLLAIPSHVDAEKQFEYRWEYRAWRELKESPFYSLMGKK
jgi:hypothetical protein